VSPQDEREVEDVHLTILDRLDAGPAEGAARTVGILAVVGPYLASVVVLALAGAIGWFESAPAPTAQVRTAVVNAPPPSAAVDPQPDLRAVAEALDAPSLNEDAKLSAIETIVDDPREAATRALLTAVDSASPLVSMASIRALRGRPCDQVAGSLVRWLAHGDWRRRAWAAKVLGENGCGDVAPELRERLGRERDPRVRRQLSAALARLAARPAA
jgi:hypothetical protein